ncbi:hypothetical protein EJB05_14061, partial [Eragrostis curvula]
MAAPPPALMADLVEDILLRFPPDDPVSLVRAALVCKEWCRIVSGPGFRRRFGELHRTAPMLGVLCNLRDDEGYYLSRFFPTASSCPPHADQWGWRALDARHGRVLLMGKGSEFALDVWAPLTEESWEVYIPPHFSLLTWNAAVLCAAHGACDHLDCHGGPFLVVLLDSDSGSRRLCVHVYSTEADAWSEPIYGPQSSICDIEMVPPALAGNTLYFLIDVTYRILKYELATANVSAIQLPPDFIVDFAVLTTAENGGLGFARLEPSGLYLWSMVTGPEGDASWTQIAVIQIETLLPVDVEISYDFIGFAHGVGVLFVGTNEGLFSIDLKSHRVRKVCDEECGNDGVHGVVPYISFYTPGNGP